MPPWYRRPYVNGRYVVPPTPYEPKRGDIVRLSGRTASASTAWTDRALKLAEVAPEYIVVMGVSGEPIWCGRFFQMLPRGAYAIAPCDAAFVRDFR